MKLIPAVILVLGILVLAFLWERFKFNECTKVGHSTVYCVAKAFD